MRLIHLPVSLILLIISILKHSIAVGMIFDPLSFIGVSIGTAKPAVSPSSICFPITFILGLIWPNLRPSPFSLIIKNVTVIDGSVSKLDRLPTTDSGWWLVIDKFEIIKMAVLMIKFMIVLFLEDG
jgi:hypothetical protein